MTLLCVIAHKAYSALSFIVIFTVPKPDMDPVNMAKLIVANVFVSHI